MTKNELAARLRREGVRDDAYALDGGLPNEAYVLAQEGAEWLVYYSERGLRTGLSRFTSEEAAADALYDRVSRDPTAHV